MSQQVEEKPKPKVYLIGIHDCEACDILDKTLKDPKVQEGMKAKYGTSDFEVIYPQDEGAGSEKAINSMFSLDKFYSPMVVVEKTDDKGKSTVCLLNEKALLETKLEEERCAQVREMPKT